MQLELFDFIDEVMDLVNKNSYIYDSGKNDISTYFANLFANEEYFLNINSRVKTPSSVQEKILRQNLYMEENDAEKLLDMLPDMIGVRIECRFISDERLVYEKIVENFNILVEDGYFTNPDNEKIVLKLDEPQPQVQKNGLDIYKVDGYYRENGKKYNFELQIKSLVNNFWGDIEHKILYKNYSYLIEEDFIKSIMNSINDSLTLIDKQLRMVYEHVYKRETGEDSLEPIKEVLKKVIYDKYFQILRNQLGFVFDFKSSVEIIVDFIFYKIKDLKYDDFGVEFLKILDRVNKVEKNPPKFDEKLDVSLANDFQDEYCKRVGQRLLDASNKDFRWNLLFKILFQVMGKDEQLVFRDFIDYLVDKFKVIANNSLVDTRFSIDERKKN